MKLAVIACGTVAVLAAPSLANAQDLLGGLLRGAARSAAQGLVNRAVGAVVSPQPGAADEARAAAAGHPPAAPSLATPTRPTVEALPADFPLPRPINYSASLRAPTDLEFSREDRNARHTFDEIGAYPCVDCEGGRGYDSLIRYELTELAGSHVLEDRLGSMAVGEAIRWTGSRTGTRYALTIAGDRGIGQWECKQLKWTGDRGEVHAERMGIICKHGEHWRTLL